ncbi:16S rRNA (cytidine(1402)-2'-O)-methyltransferase [Rikenella microfusus]|uniref:16S rRNA (cytidine(1402)-2'-O)-methyltransferase n=1 Tax=Rikenella microfusus TaxID=28139 RepID=UPI0004890641|nr:16S rRNA (cytidine(1402)-2'-O)-methyltransferase [Rikenella microfusus]
MAKLYVVPTPVGNLEDMTLRAVRVLRESDYIVAEDTRTSGNLLRHLEISKPMSSYHKFNEHGVVEQIVARMLGGQTVALVSDAGTPAISDPGYLLVSHAIAAGIDVETLPGPTAFVPALVDSGLPCDRFVFEGFLPPKKGRQSRLQQLAAEPRTMIFYESPHRAGKTLAQFAELFGGERRAALCREISKKFEETVRGTLAELAARYADKEPKGEIVLVVEGAREAAKKTRGGTSADEDE